MPRIDTQLFQWGINSFGSYLMNAPVTTINTDMYLNIE